MPQPKKPSEPLNKNERNEYIPSFISKKPFYIDDATASEDDYLEHQRLQSQQNSDPLATSAWYSRGQRAGPAATKFRKGACENCGSMTHKTKECLYRTRKQGAKWTGRDIQADEVVQDVKLGWDAKRDRWNGYDAKEYDAVIEEYNALEDMKKAAAGDAGKRLIEDGDDDDNNNNANDGAVDEGTKYDEETDMGRQQAKSTRNLRLREDTAKYLINLDLDSAKYDPKTRSMLDPGVTGDAANALVAEEGFQRASGDAAEFERAQRYAWEGKSDASAIHLQANPTAGEVTRRKEAAESESKKAAHRAALLAKYGDQGHVQRGDGALNGGASLVTESERYVEYDARGKIKGLPERKEKSMYAEDVFINKHTSVWGSWWRDFKWGYACCHATVKNSYCTGEEGRLAIEEAERFARGEAQAAASGEVDAATEVPKAIAWKEDDASKPRLIDGGARPEKVKKDEAAQDGAAKKRTLNDMKGGVTEEEMDEYRRKRTAANDPMANLLGKDELLT